MIHLYHGNGKGKTTAACGLAVRAAGSGMRVLFVQFFKDGSSSEISVMSKISGIKVIIPEICYGRFINMTEEQKLEVYKCYDALLREITQMSENFNLIVLDEAVSTYNYGFFGRKTLIDFLKSEGVNREIVLTGRNPTAELKNIADYITEMRKEKHPFDNGIMARKGIEF